MSAAKGKTNVKAPVKETATSLPKVTQGKAAAPATTPAKKEAGPAEAAVAATTPAKGNDKNAKSTTAPKLPAIQGKGKSGAATILKESTENTTESSGTANVAVPPVGGVTIATESSNTTPAVTPVVVTTATLDPAATPALTAEPSTAPLAPAPVIINNNGKVVLRYEQYNEQFDIKHGSTTHENIDEVYCLSFVMPNCLIHLSKHPPAVHRKLEGEEKYDDLYLPEVPRGTYQGLEDDQTYYVYVEQEAQQLKRDQERMRQIAAGMDGLTKKGDGLIPKDDGRAMESCSCVYGNPCVDEYGCKDWNNRYAIAMKNGWKGF